MESNHLPEEIFSFNIYIIILAFTILYIIGLFTNILSYAFVSLSICFFVTVFYYLIMYNLFIKYKYLSYYKIKQKEDSYFKPLSEEEMLKEIKYNIEDNMLTEFGDLNYSYEYIENNFCT